MHDRQAVNGSSNIRPELNACIAAALSNREPHPVIRRASSEALTDRASSPTSAGPEGIQLRRDSVEDTFVLWNGKGYLSPETAKEWQWIPGALLRFFLRQCGPIGATKTEAHLRQFLPKCVQLAVAEGALLHLEALTMYDSINHTRYESMVGVVRSPRGHVVGFQLTYFDKAGRPVFLAKRPTLFATAPSAMKGACIRLASPDRYGYLGVAATVEGAIAAHALDDVPTVAVIDDQALADYVWPSKVRHLFIYAHPTPQSLECASRLVLRAAERGTRVSLVKM